VDIPSAIIDRIRRNRISTTEIADCLGKTGVVKGVRPINPGHFCCGRVYWTYAYNESNWELHRQFSNVPEASIVIVDMFDCGDRAAIGALMAKFALLYRQARAIVAKGPVRDAPHFIRENWPVWSNGVTPIGCENVVNEKPLDPARLAAARELHDGAIAVCDDSGVVLIPKNIQDAEFIERLDLIEEQEDIWFDCIDRRKWDTFDTVCLKRYLSDKEKT
jgi:regulator of RNase E activity RraA